MVLTAQGLTLRHLRRIRIRSVHNFTMECIGAARDAITEPRIIDQLCHEKRAGSAEAATEMR